MRQVRSEEQKEKRRKAARDRARRLREDPEYRALELERNRAWRERNPEQWVQARRESVRKHYAEHRAEKQAANRKWQSENRERVNELARLARQREPERIRAIARKAEAKRRALLRNCTHEPVDSEYRLLLEADPCAYCGSPSEHIDHITPLARNGSDAWDNLTAAWARCNRRKNTKTVLEFLCTR